MAPPAAGLGDSPGGGLNGGPPLLIDGAGDSAGVADGAVELLGVGGTIGTELVGLAVLVGATEGTGDGRSEDAGLGALVISGAGTAGDGSGDEVFVWPPANEAVPIP